MNDELASDWCGRIPGEGPMEGTWHCVNDTHVCQFHYAGAQCTHPGVSALPMPDVPECPSPVAMTIGELRSFIADFFIGDFLDGQSVPEDQYARAVRLLDELEGLTS